MKKAGQKFFKLSSTEFDLKPNWNILNEKDRPEIPLSLQNFLNELRIRIKLQLSEWKMQARNSFRLSSTKFDLESNWNILNEKRRPKFLISLQNVLNKNRFRIKLQLSEWKRQARNSFRLSSTKFDLESNWNILNEKRRPEFPIFLQNFLNEFDLDPNWNILNGKRRPEFPISLQNFLNEIRFWINLKHSEWKTHARISYIFAKFPQRTSI